MVQERRRAARVPLPPIPGIDGPSLGDLSVNGLFIRTNAPWAVGHAIAIDLQPMEEGSPIPVKGKVVRVIEGARAVESGRAGMAVAFDPIPAESVERLRALVDGHIEAWERRRARLVEAAGEKPPSPTEFPDDPRMVREMVVALRRQLAVARAEIAMLREELGLPLAMEAGPEQAAPAQTTVAMKVLPEAGPQELPSERPDGAGAGEGEANQFSTHFLSLDERRAAGVASVASGPATPLVERGRRRRTPLPRAGAHAAPPAISREDFVGLLRQGQPLAPTATFFRQTPIHGDEAVLAGLLESSSSFETLRQHVEGRIAEGKLIEILLGFYRRGLLEFD